MWFRSLVVGTAGRGDGTGSRFGGSPSHVGVLLAEGSSSEAKRLYYGGGAHLRGKDTNLRVFPPVSARGQCGSPAHLTTCPLSCRRGCGVTGADRDLLMRFLLKLGVSG